MLEEEKTHYYNKTKSLFLNLLFGDLSIRVSRLVLSPAQKYGVHVFEKKKKTR